MPLYVGYGSSRAALDVVLAESLVLVHATLSEEPWGGYLVGVGHECDIATSSFDGFHLACDYVAFVGGQ